MEHFEIKREMVENAKTYMPLAVKSALAKEIAEKCLVDIDTAEQNLIGETFLAFPHLKGENAELKEVLKLNTLLGFYFDIELDDSKTGYDQFDFYAGGHLANQLERMKGDKDDNIRHKAFDLIADYKMFCKLVDNEIYNLKLCNNDLLARLMSAITVMYNPENLQKGLEELKRLTEEYEAKKAQTKVEVSNNE